MSKLRPADELKKEQSATREQLSQMSLEAELDNLAERIENCHTLGIGYMVMDDGEGISCEAIKELEKQGYDVSHGYSREGLAWTIHW